MAGSRTLGTETGGPPGLPDGARAEPVGPGAPDPAEGGGGPDMDGAVLSGRAGAWALRAALLLGLLLLVAAPVLRYWVSPVLAQSPVVPQPNGVASFVSAGTVSGLFDLEAADGEAQPSTAPVAVTRTVTSTGDAAAADRAGADGLNVAVSDTVDRITADDGRLLAETTFRLAADRHTQALVDCCGAQVGGISAGMAGAGNPLRLPWFVPRSTYPYYDTTLLAAVPMAYIGEEEVSGLRALKFQQATSAAPLGTVPVPGRLVGSEQQSVSLTRVHTVNRTLWVDPTTGIILRSAERVRDALRSDGGKDVVVLLSATLASTPEQESVQAAAAREQGRPVLWTHSYLPAAALVLGSLLLLLAALAWGIRLRARRAQQDFPDELATFDDLRDAFE